MEEAFIKAAVVCLIAVSFGATLIWRGATGDIWRSAYTGESIMPRWFYVAGGVLAILAAIGYVALTFWLAK
jgi:hypothetical protein